MTYFILTYFFIPLNEDNKIGNGMPHPEERWEWLIMELNKKFDGFTKSPGVFTGSWRNSSGEIITDKSSQWMVAIPKSNLINMKSFLGKVAEKFRQECIFFTFEGKVEFIERIKEQKKVAA